MTIYQNVKSNLKAVSQDAKAQHRNDKPAIRQTINDYVDYLCKDLNLSEYQRNSLSNYACKLHPKN